MKRIILTAAVSVLVAWFVFDHYQLKSEVEDQETRISALETQIQEVDRLLKLSLSAID